MAQFHIVVAEIELEGYPQGRGFIFSSEPEGHVLSPQQMVDALSDLFMEELATKAQLGQFPRQDH